MSLYRQVTRGLRVLTRRAAADRELDDEVLHFVDEATDAYIATGLAPADARQAALRAIGDRTRLREQVRDGGWERLVSAWLADLRLATRTLAKNPLFTAVVVLVVSIGSGAVTTIFSAMNAIVLRPIPGVSEPSTLVSLQPARRDGSAAEQGSYTHYAHLRDHARTLDGVSAWGRVSLTIAVDSAGTSALGSLVSANYFDVLGIRPALGRFFTPDEDHTPGAHPVVVVSHAFWQSRFGGAPTAIGTPVIVNGHRFTVVGVAPEGFDGIYTGMRAEAWVPLMMQPQLRPRSNLADASWLWMFGRLRDGMDADAAAAELSALSANRLRAEGTPHTAETLSSVRVRRLTGLPGGEGGPVFAFMGLLLGAATLVLLVAGVNVATMLSARYQTRQREMAVRAALGAGRRRLVQHLLAEVLMLFALGAAGGFALAIVMTAALEQLPLPEHVPVTLELSPDLRVLVFALAIALLSGLVASIGPVLLSLRMDLTTRLRNGPAVPVMRRVTLGGAFIAGQLACSLVLLVGAGLFLRAHAHGRTIDPGVDLSDVSVVWLEPESWGYDDVRARAFYARLGDRVRELGGVSAVSYTGRLPLMAGRSSDEIDLDGAARRIDYAAVDADYFAVLRLPLVEGRPFDRRVGEHDAKVAVVNETLARSLWPGASAVGRTFRFRGELVTVVGVARDAKYATLDEITPPFAYFPLEQAWHPTRALLVRTVPGSRQVEASLQQAVRALDPLLPAPRTTTLERAAAIVLLPQRAAATVTAALGITGLLLVSVGLYGIMAFSANRRTQEIGVRIALGATRFRVVAMMVTEGMRVAAIGIVLGLLLSGAAGPVVRPWLLGVDPFDSGTFLVMTAILLGVAWVASYLPARRAAAANPVASLRAE